MCKRLTSLPVILAALFPGIAQSSAIVDFDNGRVLRINDNIPQVVLIYRGKFYDWSEARMATPAGIRQSPGYATSRKLQGEEILQANEGVNGLVWTRRFKFGSIKTSYYSRQDLFEEVKYRGVTFGEMEDDGIAAYRNYLIARKALSNNWEADIDFKSTYYYSQKCGNERANVCILFNGPGNNVVCHMDTETLHAVAFDDHKKEMISNDTGYTCDPYVVGIADRNEGSFIPKKAANDYKARVLMEAAVVDIISSGACMWQSGQWDVETMDKEVTRVMLRKDYDIEILSDDNILKLATEEAIEKISKLNSDNRSCLDGVVDWS